MVESNFCDCKEDGYCLRYNKYMGGRFREICAGINIDLGTAAAFREQWEREATAHTPTSGGMPPVPLKLITDQAPGDTVCMTAAIYSLHKTHPGKFITAVESPYPEVFKHNPDVVNAETIPDALDLRMHYPAIHKCNERAIHFMQGWCEFLGYALGINVPLLTNRPRIYFRTPNPPCSDYWVICSGGKKDFTNKLWGHRNYQKVVDELKGDVRFIQVGDQMEDHPPLLGAEDRVGETTLRELFDLVRKARGVVCGVSLLMHVAAALEKPAIVIAGGREPVPWNAYPKQTYIHTVGALPCTDIQGNVGQACWRSRVVPLGDGTMLDKDTCERPVNGLPQCMRMIDPLRVAEIILSYNVNYEYNADCTE